MHAIHEHFIPDRLLDNVWHTAYNSPHTAHTYNNNVQKIIKKKKIVLCPNNNPMQMIYYR